MKLISFYSALVALVLMTSTGHAEIIATITDVQTYGPNTAGGANPGGGCFYLLVNPTMGEFINATDLDFAFSTDTGAVGGADRELLVDSVINLQSFDTVSETLETTSASLNADGVDSIQHLLRVNFEFASVAVTPSTVSVNVSGSLGQSTPKVDHSVTFVPLTNHVVDTSIPFQSFTCGPATAVPEPSAFLLLGLVALPFAYRTRFSKFSSSFSLLRACNRGTKRA